MASLPVLLAVLTLFTAAQASEKVVPTSTSCPVKGVDKSYSYDPTSNIGPADWGSLKPEYSACSSGKIQSPIDFPTSVKHGPLADGPKPMLIGNEFNFSVTTYNWYLTCSTVGSCGFTMFGGKKYSLYNVHFHSPSENTLNGAKYPLEAHFVHTSDDGDYAVLSTMFQYPDEDDYPAAIYTGANVDFGKSSFFSTVMAGVTTEKDMYMVFPGKVIDANKGYCVYTGSLTTPPCTEGVTWLLSLNVQQISKRQVHAFAVSAGASFDGNARPVQPLNKRKVTCYV